MVFVISEIASNWCGDVDLGKRLIRESKDAGADAVKMQLWDPHKIYEPDHIIWKKYPNLMDYRLTRDKARELKEYSDSIEMEWFVSVFDTNDIEFLEELGVRWYKIATCYRQRYDIIRGVMRTGKPLIISVPPSVFHTTITTKYTITRPNSEEECEFKRPRGLDQFLGDYPHTILYCVPNYPTKLEDVHLPSQFRENTGFSDHTRSITASIAAVARGATTIEKHVMSDGGARSPDRCCSITVSQLNRLVKHTRELEKMI